MWIAGCGDDQNVHLHCYQPRFALALVLRALLGLERQWAPPDVGDAAAEARVVSYIVSGVGFLGAGLIFKESAEIRGLNTAATIWCSAAVGVVTALEYAPDAAIIMGSAADEYRATSAGLLTLPSGL
jgi:uncharacterized membrane protein YhiD involved in acid resistance